MYQPELATAESRFVFGPAGDAVKLAVSAPDGDTITIPDSHLMFHADYKRVGDDLKLIGEDGTSYLVPGYFKSEKRPTLVSEEGATLSGSLIEALAGPLAPGQYAQATAPAATAQAIGKVVTVSGNATVVRNGVAITLNVGDSVLKGDVVQTGSNSSLGVIFLDSTTFNLTSNARMVLNEFVYNPNSQSNSALISLVQGSISFVAGQLAKTGDMKVDTPVATMGIRGTAVSVEINANNGATKFSVMIEPNGVVGSFNLYDKVNGNVIATVSNSAIGWMVTPVGPLQVLAQQLQKTPQELQNELALVQVIFNNQAAGQQLLNVIDPNNPNPTSTAGGSSGSTTGSVTFNVLSGPDGSPISVTVTPQNAPPPPGPVFPVQGNEPPPVNNSPVAVQDNSASGGPVVPAAATVVESGVDNSGQPTSGMPEIAGNVISNDSDPDGDALTVVSVAAVSAHIHGVLSMNADGSYTYTLDNDDPEVNALAPGESITDVFTYTIADGSGATATTTLTITINGTNDTPIAVTDDGLPGPVVVVNEDAPLVFDGALLLANDYDVDHNDTITLISVSGLSALGAAVTLVNGVITYDPTHAAALQAMAAGESLTDTLTYTIRDSYGATSIGTVNLTVDGVNDAPTGIDFFAGNGIAYAQNVAGSTLAPQQTLGQINAVDVDENDTFTYAIGPTSKNSMPVNVNGVVTQVPVFKLSADGELTTGDYSPFFGTYTLKIIATDAAGASAPAETLTIWVANANGNAVSFAGLPTDVIAFGLNGNDTIVTGNGHDTIVGGGGNDTMTGNAGIDTFIFSADFGHDTIVDFQPGVDLIQFDDTFEDFGELLASAHEDGLGNTIITHGNDTLKLSNFALANLHASDFVFHPTPVV